MRTHYRFDHSWQVDATPDAVRAPLLRAASPLLHGALARQHGTVMRSAERRMPAAL